MVSQVAGNSSNVYQEQHPYLPKNLNTLKKLAYVPVIGSLICGILLKKLGKSLKAVPENDLANRVKILKHVRDVNKAHVFQGVLVASVALMAAVVCAVSMNVFGIIMGTLGLGVSALLLARSIKNLENTNRELKETERLMHP
jgi:fructose-specific phosphotransferase system IIC component